MPFDISKFVEFDAKGRAQCPSCLESGKKGRNLSLHKEGGYHCFRGCTPANIREALGVKKDTTLPPPSIPAAAPTPSKLTITPQKAKEACIQLLTKQPEALSWLMNRGINPEMIKEFKLGIGRVRCGDKTKLNGFCHLPAITIPILAPDGSSYFQKKRVAPWMPEEAKPDGYQSWSQYGIPQLFWTTHNPPAAKETWLCEGEWDAIMLGWAVAHSPLADSIQVGSFTCGAGNVPPSEQLEKLCGQVTIWYDRNDKPTQNGDRPGDRGAEKVAIALQKIGKVGKRALAPWPDGCEVEGWDVSDAINAGLFEQFPAAAAAAADVAPEGNQGNPLRSRLVSNDQLLATAADYTDWLVDDILTADELILLAAAPRAGKSLMAMSLTKAVASGGRFLGRPVSQGAVIYIRCEDSDTKTKERELKQGWQAGLPVYWIDKFKLNELEHLEELVEELGARLVVLDTLSRIKDAAVSESSAEMSQLLEPLQEMCKKHRCCTLLVHHTGKINLANANDVDVFDTIRGSSAIRATCRGSLVLAADDRHYRLCVENGWNRLDLQILLDVNTLEWKLLGNWVAPNVDLSQKDRVLNYLSQVGSAKIDQIAGELNLPKRSLYEVLKRLQADELVEKRGDRQAALYVRRSIQQIQQLNSLLNSQDSDAESDRGSIQQKNNSSVDSEKVINEPKGDQNPDHLLDDKGVCTPGDLLNKSLEPLPDAAFPIQLDFNKHSTPRPVEFEPGDKVTINSRGSLNGQTVVVLKVEGDKVTVSRKGWATQRTYQASSLDFLMRPSVESSVELGEESDV